jgi:Acetyltransferase (GNAT) domain
VAATAIRLDHVVGLKICLKAEVISTPADIQGLMHLDIPLITHAGSTSRPQFFLASLTKEWSPLIVSVKRGKSLVGFVYAKQRRIAGFDTGCVYVDATLPNTVVAHEADRNEVLSAAINEILRTRSVKALRIVSGEHCEILNEIRASNVEIATTPVTCHSVLPLPTRYDDLVARLGSRGRRNIRYYPRRFESEGGEFVAEMSMREFENAALSILQKHGTGASIQKTQRFLKMIAAVDQPLLCGLRSGSGEWISVLGGWREDDSATVIFQTNNDVEHPKLSLGLVLRAYVLDWLIQQRVHKLFFWAGISEPLDKIAHDVRAVSVYFDKPGILWRALRGLVKTIRGALPEHLAYYAHWVAPDAN